MRRLLLALCVALLVGPALAVEQVAIASADGKLKLAGHWFRVEGEAARPAVIALHGCNGLASSKGELNPVWSRQAGYFNAERMHLLALDSFGPRGLSSICEVPNNRRTVTEDDRREDVFAAIRWLAAQPGVDASRIVVVGWSHGAQAALGVLDAADKAVQAQPVRPRAAIAFYPGCGRFRRMLNYELSAPLLVMIGELDDWTPAADCVALGNRLAGEGKPRFELTVYPGSYHAFDSLGPVQVRDNVGNTRTGKATVGGNPVAREQSHARMFEFLSEQLGQPLLLTHAERLKGRRLQNSAR
jgi:dienelactone hydrolase